MESQGKPLIPKLTLEDYLNLEHLDVIPAYILRNIIKMHGFNSQKIAKEDLLDAVRSINLMDVQHSTLQNDDVSSHAILSLDDVIKDLSVIHWQECCITCIQTINSITDSSSQVDESSSSPPKPLKIKANTSPAHYGEQLDQIKRPKVVFGPHE